MLDLTLVHISVIELKQYYPYLFFWLRSHRDMLADGNYVNGDFLCTKTIK
jgi:hypothetical protein